MSTSIQNPIIPGFYPDPSICRVKDDYYMVCSSFELYPGIPIFHSRDLMNWEQIGNVMTMENGFHMEANVGVGGVMAPTIRYNNGTFYIINANFSDKGNFIVTAKNPAGPWSEPHWLDDVPGIDASFFFDDDGKCYIMGTGDVWDNGTGVMERGIWMAGYDIEHYKCTTEPVCIFNSAIRNAGSPEAPHLYHIGDYYYLIIAEGGTEFYHSVAVARSKKLFTFFENNPGNPIMTHRMMGNHAKIGNVGHADLVQTQNGDWYAVMLASRAIEGVYKNLGRETYICPVEWERDWPLFSPETGRLEFAYKGTGLPAVEYAAEPSRDEFDGEELPMYWTMWGTPYEKYYSLSNSCLNIKCIPQTFSEKLSPMGFGMNLRYDNYVPFIARRERQFHAIASFNMHFMPTAGESAGMAVVQAMNHRYQLERVQEDGKQYLQLLLITTEFDLPPYFPGFTSTTHKTVVKKVEYDKADIVLELQARDKEYTFLYGENEGALTELAVADATLINTEQVGCMIGTMIGMYATGNGEAVDNQASFDWFELYQ